MRWLRKIKPNRPSKSRKAASNLREWIDAFEPRILLSANYSLSDIASFDSTTGNEADAPLIMDAHGNFFGTTSAGGTNSKGTVYELHAGGSAITVIASFTTGTGYDTQAPLTLDANGDLFGVTPHGGAHNDGTVFTIPASTSTITVIASFTSPDSGSSGGVVLDSQGNLYGATYRGGTASDGTVFKIANGSNTITTLASLTNVTGRYPTSGVIIDSAGNLFGTTSLGGTNSCGTIFELSAGTSSLTVLASLPSTIANDAEAPLTVDGAGDLFGTTIIGGTNSDGSVYELTAGSSTVTTIASMDLATGTTPSAGLILDANGDLFGTTTSDGPDGYGTVYEVTAGSGVITVLSSFDGTNASPGQNQLNTHPAIPSLIMDSQGNLYGVAGEGGANGMGAIYELSVVHASHATITTQPTNVIAGTIQTVTVSLELEDGTIDSSLNLPVTLSIASGPVGATLGGTLTIPSVLGVAAFSDLKLSKAGIYTLTASTTGLTDGSSTTITVTAASAAQLVLVQQPTTTIAGQTISTIAVDVEDALGNIVTTDTSTFTISTGDNTPLGGTVAVVANGGVATFTDLSITQVGAYTLSIIDGSLVPASTILFSIVPAAAAQLVVVHQPTNTLAGQAIGPVNVDVEDAFGNLVTSDSSTVSVSTVDGTPLRGGVSANAVNGVASFADLSIALVGTYTLLAIDGNLTSAATDAFTVSPAAAAKLVIDQQPTHAAAGLTMGQVVVDVEDAFGNLVADQSDVTISTNSTIAGTRTVSALNGVAVFNNLTITTPGTYQLTATDAELTAAISTSVAVIPTVVAGKKLAPMTITPSTVFTPSTARSKWLTVQVENQAGLIVMTREIAVKRDRATFENLMLKQAGNYTLVISNAKGQTMTQAFIVIAATPSRMAFITPSTTIHGSAALSVRVTDKFGNLTTARDGSAVTLRLAGNKHLVLDGIDSATIFNGVAAFPAIWLSRAGRAQLIATANKLGLAKAYFVQNT